MFGSGSGTLVLKLVDDVAWMVAARHCNGHAVTVSVDEMTFHMPIWPGDHVHAMAQVEGTGRSSMQVGVYVTAQSWQSDDETRAVAEGHFVFVALDDDGRPRPVPSVQAVSDEEQFRQKKAHLRREQRTAMRNALSQLSTMELA